MSHNLTNEVLNHIQHKRGGAFLFSEDYKAADEIITAYLREKAQELTDATIPPTNFGLKQAMEILGLSSPAPERLGEHGEKCCRDLDWSTVPHWRVCPMCILPRPAQKKRLAEIIFEAYPKCPPLGGSGYSTEFNNMASAAISWFRELVQSQPGFFTQDAPAISRKELLATLDREANNGTS